jgi:hypothetical protein
VTDTAEIEANAIDVVRKILAHLGESSENGFYYGGSCWVWDSRAPGDGGTWHLFLNRYPVDPAAISALDPRRVDRVRQQAESLVDAFLGTEVKLRQLGCDHVDLIHRPITTANDVADWAYSIWNCCVPRPSPRAEQYPLLILGTAALAPEGFEVVQPDRDGYLAVLPAEGKQARIYWALPETDYAGRLGGLLGPRHPVSLAAWRGTPVAEQMQSLSLESESVL